MKQYGNMKGKEMREVWGRESQRRHEEKGMEGQIRKVKGRKETEEMSKEGQRKE